MGIIYQLKRYLPGLGKNVKVAYDELDAAVQALLALPGTLPLIDPADGAGIYIDNGDVQTDSVTQIAVNISVPLLLAFLAAIPIVDPSDGVTIWLDGGVLKLASP
jgi:hypothetical protein